MITNLDCDVVPTLDPKEAECDPRLPHHTANTTASCCTLLVTLTLTEEESIKGRMLKDWDRCSQLYLAREGTCGLGSGSGLALERTRLG